MSELVRINNTEIVPLTHQGIRVITLEMIDMLHERPEGAARKSFNRHKARFSPMDDYFVLPVDEAKSLGIIAPNGLVLLTESGYLMLVKPFRDDTSWAVQRQLVKAYFRAQKISPPDEHPLIAQARLVLAQAEHIARVEAVAHAADLKAARAETKADMALDEAHRFTIEEFIGRNGLLRQFPESTWPAAARWLKTFCLEHGFSITKKPVPGKPWPDESAYLLQALMAWQRYAMRLRGTANLQITDDGVSYDTEEESR